METGVTGANGMVQAFPPNTGVGWYTMATGTYPADHGSTNNTFFRAGRCVQQPNLVLGRRRPPGGHDRERRRACRQEGRPDRLGRRRRRQHQRPDGRLHQLLLQSRRPRRRRRPRRAGRLSVLRRDLPGRQHRGGQRLGERADRRSCRDAEGDDLDDQLDVRRAEPEPHLQRVLLRQRHGWRRQLRPRNRQPRRQDRCEPVDRSHGRRLPAAEAHRRQRAHRRPAPARPSAITSSSSPWPRTPASSSSTTPRWRAPSPNAAPSATACRPAAQARTGSRSTSLTTCFRGLLPTSHPKRPASSTRTPTSSRAAISSVPTASRSSTSSWAHSSPTPTSRWSAIRSPTRSRTSSWVSSRRPMRTATRTRATTPRRSSPTSFAATPRRRTASRSARNTSAAPTRTPTRSSASPAA